MGRIRLAEPWRCSALTAAATSVRPGTRRPPPSARKGSSAWAVSSATSARAASSMLAMASANGREQSLVIAR